MRNLAERTALVTGAAGGIGLAIARALAEHGARVCLADKQADGLDRIAASIGPETSSTFMDLEDVASLEHVATAAADRMGKLDILVNAAGFYHMEPWGKVSQEMFDRIIAVNTRGLLFLTQAVAGEMVRKGTSGSIINVASIVARRGDPANVVYSMSKAAVISLTQSAAAAYASQGIRVNAIAPGLIQTAMWEKVLTQRGAHVSKDRPELEKAAMLRVPLKRLGTPDDQIGAAVFLASDDSSYITGQTLNVDGGICMD